MVNDFAVLGGYLWAESDAAGQPLWRLDEDGNNLTPFTPPYLIYTSGFQVINGTFARLYKYVSNGDPPCDVVSIDITDPDNPVFARATAPFQSAAPPGSNNLINYILYLLNKAG